MARNKIAVIGAGCSGLTAIKCCLEEGLEPVCFEQSGNIGGLWYYTPNVSESEGSVMKSTIINTSKEMMCYSDFPIPDEYPNYMHNSKVIDYFKLYAEKFDLLKYIRFKTQVTRVTKSTDFDTTNKWDIQVKDLNTSAVTTDTYDAIFVCIGHHCEKNLPSFPGLQAFKGKVVHTHDYKSSSGYENKRVVVVGIGNSGGDVAVELGKISDQVYLSTRRGTWVLNRVGPGGIPSDFGLNRRLMKTAISLFPASIINTFAETDLNNKFDHTLYGLRPAHRLLEAHPTVNDDLANRIIAGVVVIKPNISYISANSVKFDDGSQVDDIDTIILGTGYKIGFPCFQDFIDVTENQVDLYKYVFPPDYPTMAVIGCIQPWGAIMPISEVQCRWAVQVWKGEVNLPSNMVMREDIRRKEAEMAARYVKSVRHTIQVDFIPYMDEIAEQARCRPNIKKLLLSDPVLAWKVVNGPCTPYQYRLHGPHYWAGARQAIMTQQDRVVRPLQTRLAVQPSKQSNLLFMAVFSIILAMLIYYIFF